MYDDDAGWLAGGMRDLLIPQPRRIWRSLPQPYLLLFCLFSLFLSSFCHRVLDSRILWAFELLVGCEFIKWKLWYITIIVFIILLNRFLCKLYSFCVCESAIIRLPIQTFSYHPPVDAVRADGWDHLYAPVDFLLLPIHRWDIPTCR